MSTIVGQELSYNSADYLSIIRDWEANDKGQHGQLDYLESDWQFAKCEKLPLGICPHEFFQPLSSVFLAFAFCQLP